MLNSQIVCLTMSIEINTEKIKKLNQKFLFEKKMDSYIIKNMSKFLKTMGPTFRKMGRNSDINTIHVPNRSNLKIVQFKKLMKNKITGQIELGTPGGYTYYYHDGVSFHFEYVGYLSTDYYFDESYETSSACELYGFNVLKYYQHPKKLANYFLKGTNPDNCDLDFCFSARLEHPLFNIRIVESQIFTRINLKNSKIKLYFDDLLDDRDDKDGYHMDALKKLIQNYNILSTIYFFHLIAIKYATFYSIICDQTDITIQQIKLRHNKKQDAVIIREIIPFCTQTTYIY